MPNEFTFEPTSGDCLPAGVYKAEFSEIENFESEAGAKFGPAVKLTFRVLEGERAGELAARVCSRKFSPNANLRKLAEAMNGEKLEGPFSFTDHIGAKGTIVVEACGEDDAFTRVSTFLRA